MLSSTAVRSGGKGAAVQGGTWTGGEARDLFVAQSGAYRDFRPVYPAALYEAIKGYASIKNGAKQELVVDVGCGSGQATVPLSQLYERVIAFDASAEQVREAPALPNVAYKIGAGEEIDSIVGGDDHAHVDLITVAQALHWVDVSRFYPAAAKVLRPSTGVLATWGYQTNTFPGRNDAVAVLDELYNGVLGPYWSPRRHLLENEYAGLEPTGPDFVDVERARLKMQASMSFGHYIGYLRSWSAYQTYLKKHPDRADPIDEWMPRLREALQVKDDTESVLIEWPLFLILSRRS